MNNSHLAEISKINGTRTSDPSAWIVDSAANAFITPFKEKLHNYRHFKEEVQVKGFDGKPEVAVGPGSITLTYHRGNRQTLNDVIYIPECSEQILSLMKLRRLHGADFAFYVPRRIPFQTAYSSLENQSTTYSTSGNQPLSSPMLLPHAAPPKSEKSSKSMKTMSRMSIPIQEVKLFTRTHSQSEKQQS